MQSRLFHALVNGSQLPPGKSLGRPIEVMYEDEVLPGDRDARPTAKVDEQAVLARVRAAMDRQVPLIFDIECWRTLAAFGGKENELEQQTAIDRFTEVAAIAGRGAVEFGFCGAPSSTLGQNLYYPWMTQNFVGGEIVYPAYRWLFDRQHNGQAIEGPLVPGRLARLVTLAAPTLYAEKANPNMPKEIDEVSWWLARADAHLPIWRMWGKPIYLFLSQHYYGDKPEGTIGRRLAEAMTAWCVRNGVHRIWWGEWIDDSDWYEGAA